jgi:site-specific DNA-methyltransferase (adenine-specific)
VLRDVTERVVVASKGRFDRALPVRERQRRGLPFKSTLRAEDFLALTLDVWSIPPESARRVGHPAPFPVELPEQLIRLYTFEDDLVLDPFMGSGSALVAAARLGRRYVGYDLDPAYVALARERVAAALAERPASGALPDGGARRGVEEDGASASRLAERALGEAGFTIVGRDQRVRGAGVVVAFGAVDAEERPWLFDVPGPFTTYRGGLQRADVTWRALGRAAAVGGVRRTDAAGAVGPLVLLTTDLPRRGSEPDTALRAAGPEVVFDVVDVLSARGRDRLARYAKGELGPGGGPLPGFWRDADLGS